MLEIVRHSQTSGSIGGRKELLDRLTTHIFNMIDHIWLHQRAAVGDRRKCICQFQVADALCQTAECCRESLILAYEGVIPSRSAYSTPSCGVTVSAMQRRATMFNGIGNAVADRVIALVIAAPPVRNSFSPEEYGPS